jgi:hypothetical protein
MQTNRRCQRLYTERTHQRPASTTITLGEDIRTDLWTIRWTKLRRTESNKQYPQPNPPQDFHTTADYWHDQDGKEPNQPPATHHTSIIPTDIHTPAPRWTTVTPSPSWDRPVPTTNTGTED